MSFKVPLNIKRNRIEGSLTKTEMVKTTHKQYDKRIIIEDYKTVPYGYTGHNYQIFDFTYSGINDAYDSEPDDFFDD